MDPPSTHIGHPTAETDSRETVVGGLRPAHGTSAAGRCVNSSGRLLAVKQAEGDAVGACSRLQWPQRAGLVRAAVVVSSARRAMGCQGIRHQPETAGSCRPLHPRERGCCRYSGLPSRPAPCANKRSKRLRRPITHAAASRPSPPAQAPPASGHRFPVPGWGRYRRDELPRHRRLST